MLKKALLKSQRWLRLVWDSQEWVFTKNIKLFQTKELS